ncbi:MAG: insulinase family protein [Acidobacteria bacterium]|nr:insulinase family protein [Acidobacteriota bacterium]
MRLRAGALAAVLLFSLSVRAEMPENVSKGSKVLLKLASAPLDWKIPVEGVNYRKVTSASGLKFYLKPDDTVPMVTVHCRVGAGAVFETDRTPHTAKVTARMVRECGSAGMTTETMEATLDFYAGQFEMECGPDWVTIDGSIPSRHLESLIKILAGVLSSPGFSEERLKFVLKRMQAEDAAASDDPFYVCRKKFYNLLYPKHPYGYIFALDGIEKVTLEDVKKFYTDWYCPANIAIAVTGDFKEKDFLALWDQYYQGAPPNRELIIPRPPRPSPVPGVYLVQRNVNQSSIYFGVLLPEEVRPEIPLLNLVNHVTGGGDFASRFTQQVRDREGLAYRVDSLLNTDFLGNFAYVARCRTKTESTERAIDAMLWILDIFRQGKFTDGEFQAGKSALRTSVARKFTSVMELLKVFMTLDLLGRPYAFIDEYPAKVMAITPEQLKEMAVKCFDVSRMVYVVVGDVKEMDKLKKLGPVTRLE